MLSVGNGLVRLFDIRKHREPKVAQPGGVAKFFVSFLNFPHTQH